MSEAEIMLVLGFVMPRTINEHDGLYDHEIADLLRAMGRRLKTGGRIDRIIGRRLETTASDDVAKERAEMAENLVKIKAWEYENADAIEAAMNEADAAGNGAKTDICTR